MADTDYDTQSDVLFSQFQGVFQSIDNATDVSSDLFLIIKTNPTFACIDALVASLFCNVEARPRDVDNLVLSFKNLLDMPDAGAIRIDDYDEQAEGPIPFADVFKNVLADRLKDTIHETQLHVPKHTEISPTNPTLSAALFSGSVIKNQALEGTSASYAFARQGLQLPDADRESDREETVALGACLQLAIAGARMMEEWLGKTDGQDAVVEALKALKVKHVVKSSNGVRLLDVSSFAYAECRMFNIWFTENDCERREQLCARYIFC
ncbi:hypothetical protein B0H34DRAFT_673993 [Crassisporium funariophilum]|nr:hypothetical protein B0H34DRAFT_673993 [Crassisporium funariophilum]